MPPAAEPGLQVGQGARVEPVEPLPVPEVRAEPLPVEERGARVPLKGPGREAAPRLVVQAEVSQPVPRLEH